ncbi:sperm-associated antigen 11-like [Mastomys coucha]|uniref:sperm-associated antigen 11-like n=1 Tax=Mastomys coucha TaxID=35658 RepID=UPI001261A320|nr:sperm-associated antigen 11-like [Mastomys coucha]
MKLRLLPSFASLLLVALLFPGLSSASSINHLVTEHPSFPEDEFPARGVNGSQSLHHRVKRLPPYTPPYRGKSSTQEQGKGILWGNAERM